jgi:hypothetical protein
MKKKKAPKKKLQVVRLGPKVTHKDKRQFIGTASVA